MAEVKRLSALEGYAVNEAKKTLAFEVTKMVHGEQEALQAQAAAEALFTGTGNDTSAMPSTTIKKTEVEAGISILDILTRTGLVASKSEGRRLIDQGSICINEERMNSVDTTLDLSSFQDGQMIIRKGKKVYHQVNVES